jgi:DNA-binding NarL/FixJ family response regulator
MWLEAVEAVLDRVGVRVVGKAVTPPAALAIVADNQPDLFVTEMTLEDQSAAISCLKDVQERAPGIRCIVLCSSTDSATIEAALAAGAAAVVLKNAHPDDLASAVRQAFDHSVYLARRTSSSVPDGQMLKAVRPLGGDAELTNREREILRLVAEGHSNAQLAAMLWVTEQTVKFHLSNVYRKLNVSNRTEAARWAQLHGLLPTGHEVTAA